MCLNKKIQVKVMTLTCLDDLRNKSAINSGIFAQKRRELKSIDICQA